MYDKALQLIHDEIWRQIYERQKRARRGELEVPSKQESDTDKNKKEGEATHSKNIVF